MEMKRGISALLFVTMVAGCMGPPRVVSSPKTYLPIHRPDRIWIREAGSNVLVTNPRILGDSLYGKRLNGEEVWVALDDRNTVISAREVDKTKTFALIGGAIAGVVLVGAMMGSDGQSVVVENEDAFVPAARHAFTIGFRIR